MIVISANFSLSLYVLRLDFMFHSWNMTWFCNFLLVSKGLCGSDDDSTDDEMVGDLLPHQRDFRAISDDSDEEDNEESEE